MLLEVLSQGLQVKRGSKKTTLPAPNTPAEDALMTKTLSRLPQTNPGANLETEWRGKMKRVKTTQQQTRRKNPKKPCDAQTLTLHSKNVKPLKQHRCCCSRQKLDIKKIAQVYATKKGNESHAQEGFDSKCEVKVGKTQTQRERETQKFGWKEAPGQSGRASWHKPRFQPRGGAVSSSARGRTRTCCHLSRPLPAESEVFTWSPRAAEGASHLAVPGCRGGPTSRYKMNDLDGSLSACGLPLLRVSDEHILPNKRIYCRI